MGRWLGFLIDFQSDMVAVPDDKIESLKSDFDTCTPNFRAAC